MHSRSGRSLLLQSRSLRALAVMACLAPCLSAQVVLNEILADNRTSLADDDGDFSDWVELHNSGAAAVALGGYTLGDDSGETWSFPDVSIAPGGYLLVWLSGKNRHAPPANPATASPEAFRASLVSLADEWRYVVADAALTGPPSDWATTAFDDNSWATGRAGFGYGDGDDVTILAAETPAVFVRRKFQLERAAAVASLVLRLDFDDGFVAYLNGQRVLSEGALAEEPTFQSTATTKREAGEPFLYDLAAFRSVWRDGENVLALVGLNNLPSTDMSLLPELGHFPAFLHASLRLDREGETLVLTNAAAQVIDSVTFSQQTGDHSYGRQPDAFGAWRYFLTPTPEAANRGETFDVPIPDDVVFTPPGGNFVGEVLLSLTFNAAGPGELRYTLDGTAPTAQSDIHTEPITLKSSTVITAAGFLGTARSTPIVARSYFFTSGIALPVLSLSMDPTDYQTVHNSEGARGRASERPARFEYFDAGFHPVSAIPCGLRLHGGAGRGGDFQTKKSYKCYFRGAYGARRLREAIIPDTFVSSFDKLVLRAGFNDAFRTNNRGAYLRDQLVRDLHEEMGGIVSHGTWCTLYVNMRFRGLYNVVERIDDEFLESYTGESDWDVIKTGNEVLAGSSDEWNRVRDFCLQSDLAQEDLYRQAEALVDVPNFASYMLINIWAQNHDWISNNWYAARPRRADGKWLFFCWDAEFGVGLIPSGSTSNTFEFVFERQGHLRDIFEGLLRSPIFRRYFVEEADRFAYGALLPARVVARIDALKARVAADIPEELVPYGQPVSQWNANVEEMKAFARARNTPFLNSILQSTRYQFPAVTTPRVTSSSPAALLQLGGEQVVLSGARLSVNTQIAFNGVLAAGVEGLVPGRLRVTLPFDARVEGPVIIEARDPVSGSASQAHGLLTVTLPRPLPTEIVPARGSSHGGEIVRIAGAGFLPGVVVEFGGTPATSVQILPGDPPALEVVTPPGNGTQRVTVVNHVAGGAVPSRVELVYTYLAQSFLRGDANGDGTVDISDSILILGHLFVDGAPLRCRDAADADDSGVVELTDAVFVLLYLFQGGREPPAPSGACGDDLSGDQLGCDQPGACLQ